MKSAELIEGQESILYNLNREEFDLEKFKGVAKDTLEVVLPELKEKKNADMDLLKLLIKMTRFSERELYSNEQEAAQYLNNEILYAVENGSEVLDITALIDVNFKGYFTLECSSSLIKYDQWTGKRRNFDKSSKLREPQLFMQRHIEKMMYDTAKWMLYEYGIFEN